MTMRVLMSILMGGISCSIFAGIVQDLDDYLVRSGFSKHATRASAFKSQMAGHFVGGSLVLRSPARHYQLADISLPKISAGCGGIDLHMGSFSHISSDQFSNLGQLILTEAPPIAFDLALSELSPNLKDIKDHMVQIMNTVNMASIHSCEMAQGIVGALAPKMQYGSEHLCKMIATDNGILSDYVSSRHGCEMNSQTYQATLKTAKAKHLSDLLVDGKNVAWYAMKRNRFYGHESSELRHLLMSLTGTVIFDSKQSPAPMMYPSKAVHQGFIKALLHGGEIKLYQCVEQEACLTLSTQTVLIKKEEAFSHKIRIKIRQLVEKAHDPQKALTEDDKAFLEATHFPLYKFVNVEAATSMQYVNTRLEEYADLIAIEILTHYLQEQIALIRASALKLKADPDTFKVFDAHAEKAYHDLASFKMSAYDKLAKLDTLIERANFLERALSNRLGAHLSTQSQ